MPYEDATYFGHIASLGPRIRALALDVDRFLIARVGVADDRDVHRSRKRPDVLDHLPIVSWPRSGKPCAAAVPKPIIWIALNPWRWENLACRQS
jgi:hypothetical protein